MGKLVCVPMHIMQTMQIIKHWIKILKPNHTSLKKTYLFLKQGSDTGSIHRGSIRALQVELKRIFKCLNSNIDIPFPIIKQRTLDSYLQNWYSSINNSSCLGSYCNF